MANIITRSGSQKQCIFSADCRENQSGLSFCHVSERARLSAWFMVPVAPSLPQGRVRSPWCSVVQMTCDGSTGFASGCYGSRGLLGLVSPGTLSKPLESMAKSSLADWFLKGLYPIFSRSPVQIFLDSDFCFSGLGRN